MGNWKVKVTLLILIVAFSSCEKFEIRGFFAAYENVNERFAQSMDWNSNGYSEINIPQRSYTIHAMGDSHVGGTENLDRFLQDARDENVTAVVMVGDITTGNKDDYTEFSKHLPPMDSLQYFTIVGNHDLYFDGWKHFSSMFGTSSYFFVVNTPGEKDLFICLDTGGGTLGDKQYDWFKNLLETDRESFRYCVVFTHDNLLRLRPTTSTNPMVEEIEALLDLFTRYHVNMVVNGHDHKHNTDILGNTTHIIMDALQDVNDKATYLKLIINEERIDYSFVAL